MNRSSLWGRLLAVALGLTLGCGVLELAARALLARQIEAFRAQAAADPSEVSNLFKADDALNWVHRPGASFTVADLADQVPFSFTDTITAQGLYDLDYAYARPANGFRMVVLGDSFVEAVQVPLHRRSFQQVEDRHYPGINDAPYEIIEMGVARYSPSQSYKNYVIEGRRYQPDVVILMLYLGNDLEEMHPAAGHNILIGIAQRGWQYTLVDGSLVEVAADEWQPPNDTPNLPLARGLYVWLNDHSVLVKLLTGGSVESSALAHQIGMAGGEMPLASRLQVGYADPMVEQVWPIFEAVIRALRDEVEADGTQFAVVIAPEMYAVHPEWYFEDNPAGEAYRDQFDATKTEQRITAFLDGEGIPYLSLTPALQAAAQSDEAPLYYHSNTHWTPAGHDVVAAALAEWFEVMGWSAGSNDD